MGRTTMRQAAILALVLGAVAIGCDSGLTTPDAEVWAWEYPYLGAPCDTLTQGPSLTPAQRDSLPGPGGHVSIDDRNAEVARLIPGGWGGNFVRDKLWKIYLVHPDSADVALAALRAAGVPAGSRWEILQARWDFGQLYDWYRYLARHAWIKGVFMSDIDEGSNRLEYGVTPAALPEFATRLASLGVPCGLVRARVGENGFVFDRGG